MHESATATPLVSVLVPSRERPGLLRRSLASLGKGDFEVLVRVDADDPSLSAYDGLANLVVGPRLGYARLHEYYNELAARARGNWLLIWNDDSLMETQDWLEVVRGYGEQLVVLNPETNHDNYAIDMNVFPILPRALFEALGHLSLSRHTDSWIEAVARELGIMVRSPIRIHHDRADLTGNNADAVYDARVYDHVEFHSEAMRAARGRDAEQARSLLPLPLADRPRA